MDEFTSWNPVSKHNLWIHRVTFSRGFDILALLEKYHITVLICSIFPRKWNPFSMEATGKRKQEEVVRNRNSVGFNTLFLKVYIVIRKLYFAILGAERNIGVCQSLRIHQISRLPDLIPLSLLK